MINVAVPTRNRPELLARVLDSLALDAGEKSLSINVLISDQSSVEFASKAREVAKSCAVKFRSMCFIGRQEAMAFEGAVSSDFELYPRRHAETRAYHGLNRNLISLFFAGQKYCSFDDDVVVRHVMPVERSSGGLIEGLIPWGLSAFSSEDELMGRVENCPVSAIGSLTSSLCAKNDSDRRISSLGVVGHSGLGTHLLCSKVGSISARQRLFASDRSYQRALDSIWCIRQAPFDVSTNMHGFIATAFAENNTVPLIPFIPYGRGEDRVYGSTLAQLVPHLSRSELGSSVLHFPTHGRVPARMLDIASPASMLLSLVAFGATRSSSAIEPLLEVRRQLMHRDWMPYFRRCFMDFIEAEIGNCREVGGFPDLCGSAVRVIARVIEDYKALAKLCERSELDSCFEENRNLAIEWLGIAVNWGTVWERAREVHSKISILSRVEPLRRKAE